MQPRDQQVATRVRRWVALGLLLSLGLFVGLVLQTRASGTFGIDFGVFHAGGDLIATSGFDAAYDTDVFSRHLADGYFPSSLDRASNTHFISTPVFGWFMQPASRVPFDTALLLWLIAGVAALVLSVRWLELPWWVFLAALVSPAASMNFILGQTGPFVLALFVWIHRFASSNRRIAAGLLVGLLILKPPLAVGYGVMWLVSGQKNYRTILSAAGVGFALTVPTVIGGLRPWTAFLESIGQRAEIEGRWTQQSFGIVEFLKLLSPGADGTTTILFWCVGLLTAFGISIWAWRRWPHDPEMLSVVAVMSTLFASPHLLIYDSFILIIPVAVLWKRGVLDAERVAMVCAVIVMSIALGPVLYAEQARLLGRGIGLEFVALAGLSYLGVRWLSESTVVADEVERVSAITS